MENNFKESELNIPMKKISYIFRDISSNAFLKFRNRTILFRASLLIALLKLISSLLYQILPVPVELKSDHESGEAHKIIIEVMDYVIIITTLLYSISYFLTRNKMKKVSYFRTNSITTEEKIFQPNRFFTFIIMILNIVPFIIGIILWAAFSKVSVIEIYKYWPSLAAVVSTFFVTLIFSTVILIYYISLPKLVTNRAINRIKTLVKMDRDFKVDKKTFGNRIILRTMLFIDANINGTPDLKKMEATTVSRMHYAFMMNEILKMCNKYKYVHKNLALSPIWSKNKKTLAKALGTKHNDPKLFAKMLKEINKHNKGLLSQKDIKEILDVDHTKMKFFLNDSFKEFQQKNKSLNLSFDEIIEIIAFTYIHEINVVLNKCVTLAKQKEEYMIHLLAKLDPVLDGKIKKIIKSNAKPVVVSDIDYARVVNKMELLESKPKKKKNKEMQKLEKELEKLRVSRRKKAVKKEEKHFETQLTKISKKHKNK